MTQTYSRSVRYAELRQTNSAIREAAYQCPLLAESGRLEQ